MTSWIADDEFNIQSINLDNVVMKPLENTITEYISNQNFLNFEKDVIAKINNFYVPLSFSIDTQRIENYSHMLLLIKQFIKYYFYIDDVKVEYFNYGSLKKTVFYVYYHSLNPIYVTNSQLLINQKLFENYEITDDLLYRYIDSKYIPSTLNDDYNLKSIMDEYTIKKQKGYIVFPINMYNEPDLVYLVELCKMFDIKIIHKYITGWILKIKFNTTIYPLDWIMDSINRIKNGLLPLVKFNLNYTSTDFSKAKIFYGSVMSYYNLIKTYPHLSSAIFDIEIYNDLSVNVPLATIDQIYIYYEIYTDYLSVPSNFKIYTAKDLSEAIRIRYTIQEEIPLSKTLIYQDDIFYVISETIITAENKKINEKIISEKEIINKLKPYFSNCMPMTDVSLNELTNIIPLNINADKHGPPFYSCYPYELPNDNTLSFKNAAKIENGNVGWRGFYDIGILKGLFNDIPFLELKDVNNGEVKINQVEDNLYSIRVNFKNNNQLQLFSLKTKQNITNIENKLLNKIQTLWDKGYFMNLWSIMYHINHEDDYHLIVNNPIFVQGQDSYQDGDKAITTIEFLYDLILNENF